MRGQRVGIDHRRDRIGGVVKPVHEFEPERDQQREPEEQDRADRDILAHARGIDRDAHPGIAQPDHRSGGEQPAPGRMERRIEPRTAGMDERLGGDRSNGSHVRRHRPAT